MIGFWDGNCGNVQRSCIVDSTRMLEVAVIRSKQIRRLRLAHTNWALLWRKMLAFDFLHAFPTVPTGWRWRLAHLLSRVSK
jgi:hypothetical protein